MRIISLIIIASAFFSACQKDENNKPQNNKRPGIAIRGKISALKSSGNSLADAKKIMVFMGLKQAVEMDYSFVDIVADTFVADTRIGQATALIFLDANNKYIGTLSTRGLSVLPLCSMPAGDSSSINLSTLTLVGTTVIPSHDPFGDEIRISEDDINSLKAVDSYYEYLAKNIDADNDGALDILSDRQITVRSMFSIEAGKIGINENSARISDSAIRTITYNTFITGGRGFITPSSAALSGPEGDPYEHIEIGYLEDLDNNQGFTTGVMIGKSFFKKGVYTLTLDDKAYTIAFSSMDASENLVIASPQLTTNQEGKLVSVSVNYQNADLSPLNPENLISELMFQINDSLLNKIYESPWLNGKYSNHDGITGPRFTSTITLQNPLDISQLKNIDISYIDLLGNQYYLHWYNR